MPEAITRRSALGRLGAVGVAVAAGTLGAGAPAGAQGASPAFGLQESVQDGLKRVFGGRPMKDGTALIKLELPPIAENGAVVPVSVEVNAPMTPEAGQAFVGANIRLGETTDVRAIVEQSDGTLLTAKREVKVTVGGCGG